ncbi:MAG: hypothetical protein ACTSQI_13170 [Candidatus Helarchaeota archaeon]
MPKNQAEKKVKKASTRIEKKLQEGHYTKLSIFVVALIDFFIFAGVLFLTSNIFAILLVYGYVMLTTLISIVPLMVKEYERVGRRPPLLVRFANSLLKKILPIDRIELKMGPTILVGYTYLLTIGGFIAIGIITFADTLTGNFNMGATSIYGYMITGFPSSDYGYFTFINGSLSNSMLPTILWAIIISVPAIFCFLFLTAAIYYRNNKPVKLLSVVVLSPLIIILPLFFTTSSILGPSVVIALVFLVGWVATVLIWYRQATKRNAFILFSILFAQVLASILIIYGFIFYNVAQYTPDISPYYNPFFILIWLSILVLIPIIVKGFDSILHGKTKILGPVIAVSIAVTFQYYFFHLFNKSVIEAYFTRPQLAEIYVGFGFFYFYIALLLIPLFFIFGYFQIGFIRSIFRSLREYGRKIKKVTLFTILGAFLATILIIGLVIVYYLFSYTVTDYQNMFTQTGSLFNGNLVARLVSMASSGGEDPAQIFQFSSLAITIGLLAYSSYRGAYNFAQYADHIEDTSIKRLGVFKLVIFTDPRSYKTRLLFGLSLISVFLGISTIIAFLKIHSYLFPEVELLLANPSIIFFETIDAVKLAISIVGLIMAISIFFYFIGRKKKV